MSAALRNLCNALHILTSIQERPSQCSDAILFQLNTWHEWDAARERHYREEKSRRIFDWVQQTQIVCSFFGAHPPVLPDDPPYSPQEWAELEKTARTMTTGFAAEDYLLDRIDTWLLECYTLPGLCEVEPGDTVLDCGTYSGNTSLYFAGKTGPEGRVYGFEASPRSFSVYSDNVRDHANIFPVNAAVCGHCGTATFAELGVGAHINTEGVTVPATTLDGFFAEKNLERVDFIKMDIEGAEISALRGAETTIQRFTPKMALSAYHKYSDLLAIPKCLEAIAPGRYTYRLRHFSPGLYETVLYCVPKERAVDEPLPPPETEPAPPVTQGQLLLLAKESIKAFMRVVSYQDASVTKHMELQSSLMEKLEEAEKCLKETTAENERLQLENMALRSILEKRHSGK